jgi:mannose-6-phosphate isomerase-like protein (cupin superfamily)
VFIVIEGTMQIEFEDRTIELREGEMLVVPKGVRHKPYAEAECKVMLVEPRGVVNTGDAEGNLTAPNDDWI